MAKIGELIQSFMMSNPKRAIWSLTKMPEGFWLKKGRQKAITVFHKAAKEVPAYAKLLEEKGVSLENIKTFEDFKKLPFLDKDNYIRKYRVDELCLGGMVDRMYTIATSSGSTGTPSFWPRLPKQDLMLPTYFELLYLQNWDIDKKSTLFIVTMALGNWIAGELVSTMSKIMAMKGKYRLTVATPGSDVKQISTVVKGLASYFDQVVMVAYPSLVKSILEEGEKDGIDWKKTNLKFWLGGEGCSDELRKYILDKIADKDEKLNTLVGVYGTSDAGGIGFGSPLANRILKLIRKDEKLYKTLFGNIATIPSLVQYNPLSYFIEEIEEELVITYGGGIPLIRYNIHDKGKIFSYNNMLKILYNHGYNIIDMLKKEGCGEEKIWRWPFLAVFGRSSNTISIIGANVYPENIEATLYANETKDINSFKLSVQTDKQGSTHFYILIEMKEDNIISLENKKDFEKKYHDIFLRKLLENNLDYKDAYEKDLKTADPIIKLYGFGCGPFSKKLETKQSFIHNEAID